MASGEDNSELKPRKRIMSNIVGIAFTGGSSGRKEQWQRFLEEKQKRKEQLQRPERANKRPKDTNLSPERANKRPKDTNLSPERAIKRLKDTNLRQEKTIQDLKDEKLRQEEINKKLTEENLRQKKSIQDLKDETLRQEETNKKLTEENLRQEEQSKKLVDENLRLQDENSNMEERHQRQEETIKKLTDENLRTKQLGKYGFLYYWLHSDCHVSLETPARTYIGIHPPLTKGYHPDKLNVVQSLEEDVKRLGNPVEIIPLVGLNVDEIDEWYKTIDVHYAQWSKDYSLLETALCKGSDDFKNYLAKHKPSIQNQKSPLYIYAAAWDHSHK